MLSQLNRVATLEEDLALLKRGEPGHPGEPIGFELRMAVVYRSEKKKIMHSQINLIQKVKQVLRGCEEALEGDADAQSPEEFEENRLQAYNRLILAETEAEAQQRGQVASDAALTEEQR